MPSVLIVDDELAIRDMVRMALEMDEFVCLEAGSAKDAYSIMFLKFVENATFVPS